jgi:DNA-binding NtrC family response regulator
MPLALRFAERAVAADKTPISFSVEAVEMLVSYSWPGNVRELENAIERAAALCDHVVRPEDLPEHLKQRTAVTTVHTATEKVDAELLALKESWPQLAEWEKFYVKRVLMHTKGNRQAAARVLNVDRKTIDRMINRHGIDLNSL